MAEHRTGTPRREGMTGVGGTASSSYVKTFDPQGYIESTSLGVGKDKERNERYSAQKFNAQSGIVVKRWGTVDGQEYEQAVQVFASQAEIDSEANEIINNKTTAGTPGDPPVPDSECCAWLQINAPSNVESGSTSGVSAGGKKGCVYYWSIVGCNPTTWGCGSLTAAGTGGSGAGIHQTSLGMVFIAPTIPDKDTINCGKTVDTQIKVAVLTADGQKQLAGAVGTAGWSGFGMGPGDELYDLFGPEEVCSETANITTNADDCLGCTGSEIGFTTQHMPTGSTQGLMVLNGSSAENYTWELIGGGSLSKKTGMGTTYVAPLTNYKCEENALITLKCNGVVMDMLGIAVYAPGSEWTPIGNYLVYLGLKYPNCDFLISGGCHIPYTVGYCFDVYETQEYTLTCSGMTYRVDPWLEQTLCAGLNCFLCSAPSCHTGAEPCYNGIKYRYDWLTKGQFQGCCGEPPTS